MAISRPEWPSTLEQQVFVRLPAGSLRHLPGTACSRPGRPGASSGAQHPTERWGVRLQCHCSNGRVSGCSRLADEPELLSSLRARLDAEPAGFAVPRSYRSRWVGDCFTPPQAAAGVLCAVLHFDSAASRDESYRPRRRRLWGALSLSSFYWLRVDGRADM